MIEPYIYVPFHWLDQIVELDEFGNTVYERDDHGNIVFWKDDFGNMIIDPIKKEPIPKPRLLQVGTRHSAARENYQEQGIAKAHERLNGHDSDILRLQINQELDGKAPGNGGTFSDTFDGEPNKLIRQIAKTVLTESRAAGTTVLNVDGTSGFKPFTEVTIYDDENSEDILITQITDSTITVQALQHNYKKGAVIARSNALIDHGVMSAGYWGTYVVNGEVV